MKKIGQGKSLLTNGSTFIGNYKNNKMADGNLFELQENATYKKFEVAYDHEKDF